MHPRLFDQEVGSLKLTITSPLAVCVIVTHNLVVCTYYTMTMCVHQHPNATAKLFVILIRASATLAPLQRPCCFQTFVFRRSS